MATKPWKHDHNYTEYHVRPGTFNYSPKAHLERVEVRRRRHQAAAGYQRAKELTAHADHEEAERQLEQVVAAQPDKVEYIRALADCIAHGCNDPGRSLPWFDEVLKVDPKDATTHLSRGRALAKMGNVQDAAVALSKASELAPDNPRVWVALGMCQQALGEFRDAIRCYTHAADRYTIAGEPVFEVLINRGICYRCMANEQARSAVKYMESSVKDLDEAASCSLRHLACRLALGTSLAFLGRHHQALDVFRNCVMIAPSDPVATNNLGLIHLEIAQKAPSTTAAAPARKNGATQSMEAESSADDRDVLADSDSVVYDLDVDALEAVDYGALAEQAHEATEAEPAKQRARRRADQTGTSKSSQLSDTAIEHLEEAIQHFTSAAENYVGHLARGKGEGDDVQIATSGEAVDPNGGILLVLDAGFRTPGFPVLHNNEIQAGELSYNRARALLLLGRLDEAYEALLAASKANEIHPHYPHYQGVISQERGDNVTARTWFERALSLDSRYVPSIRRSAQVLQALGEQEEALEHIDDALRLKPGDWELFRHRASCLQDLGRHEEAIAALHDAINSVLPTVPDSTRAALHFSMAQSALTLKISSTVVSALRACSRLGFPHGRILNLRGLLARSFAQVPKAVQCLTEGLLLDPTDCRLLYDRALCYKSVARYRQAVADLSRALLLLPDNTTLLYERACCREAMRQYRLARVDFERAVELDDDGMFVFDEVLYEGSKFLNSSTVAPEFTSDLWFRLGCLRLRDNDVNGALDAFLTAERRLPGNPDYMHWTGVALHKLGRYQEAVAKYCAVLELEPSHPDVLLRRGLAYKSLGRYAEAAEDLETVRTAHDEDPRFLMNYHDMHVMERLHVSPPGAVSQARCSSAA